MSKAEMASRSTLYTTEILRLAASLAEPRALAREDGRAELRSPTCGSMITVAVQVDADGRVECVAQQVHACAFGQASAALLEQGAVGRSFEEISAAAVSLSAWLSGEREDAGDWPGLDVLSPARPRTARHGAILLPFRALAAALESRK